MAHRRSSWLLLIYKVPPEPSRVRVAVWRRIRSLGAVYIHSGICVLPASSDHRRQLRMVQSEIERARGEAMILETSALDPKQEEIVISRFKYDRDQDYQEFLDKCADYRKEIDKEIKAEHYTFAELKENDEDLRKLKGWLARIKAIDFYGAPARAKAEQELAECEELLEQFAHQVFEREQSVKSEPMKKPGTVEKNARRKTGRRGGKK